MIIERRRRVDEKVWNCSESRLAFNRMVEELRTRERIKETFGKFVDPRIVSRLIGDGAEQAERRNLTVFFSDIKGFAGISEQLTAGAVVNLLNSYFGAIAAVMGAFLVTYPRDRIRSSGAQPRERSVSCRRTR